MHRLLSIITVLFCTVGCMQLQINQFSTAGVIQPKVQVVWSGIVEIDTDYIIPVGTTVTILPGASVRFLSPKEGSDQLNEHPYFVGSELIVRGELIANGTLSNPILFTADNAQKNAGSWGGLNIEGGRVTISYCLFSQANSAIHARDATVVVRESIFTNNLVGLRFHSSDIKIENNSIYQNDTGVRFHFGSPIIRRNLFEGNDKSFFITDRPQDYQIKDNYIAGSRTYHVVLGESITDDVDLTNNCWTATSESVLPLFFDKRVDGYLGEVVISPECKMSIDTVGASWKK